MTSKRTRNLACKSVFLPEESTHRVIVMAKLYGADTLDWPGVKRLLHQHLPPSDRVGFASRGSNKLVPWPNAFEKQLIGVWEGVTGVLLVYPVEKMQKKGVSTLRRGQSTHGFNKRQDSSRATPEKAS